MDSHPNGNASHPFTDVLIAGAGPVGLLLAILLSQAQIPCTVVESSPEIIKSTKSIAYHPSMFALLTRAGILDEMKKLGIQCKPPVFRKAKDGQIIAETGGPNILVLPQWKVRTVMIDALNRRDGVTTLIGTRVVDIRQNTENNGPVTVTLGSAHETQKPLHQIQTRYLIGADGGRSFIRKALQIPFTGTTLPSQLVATDVYYPFDAHGFVDTQFMVDPENFGLVSRMTNDGLYRVSVAMPNSVTKENIDELLPARYEAMFPGPRPLEYRIENLAPYKCQQLCAETMVKGRIAIVGDAAHCKNVHFSCYLPMIPG
jgi:2-polyprenyl-6-methoxyphenol hydroxylase-like FAD-dependent oxidoreductase